MKIQDMLVVSDLDGTLVPISGRISEENRSAIRRFRETGGTFTIATGRSPIVARKYAELLEVQGPVICDNGAVIYDFEKEKCLWTQQLPEGFQQTLQKLANRYPKAGICAAAYDGSAYILCYTPLLDPIAQHFQSRECSAEEIPSDCCKAILMLPPKEMDFAAYEIMKAGYPSVDFVRSGQDCLEIMAKGISKGSSLERLALLYGKSVQNTIGVGDHQNDLELIRDSGFGAAMGNALPLVKAEAQLILPDCEENGIAFLLEYLMEHHASI